jgi:DNA-binding CsgD family transcriptional regulator/tetratricopeptide (TPR) repeat protein
VSDNREVRLLERDTQLGALRDYAQEASAGRGRLVLVAGEAGVGKSSLLEELAAGDTQAVWCWGACDGLFTPRPLAPLLDIASQLGGRLEELSGTGAPREELFGALLRQIRDADALTVFAIEDVHWADEATLDMLRFLGRRIRDAKALLLVTYRDDGLSPDHPLRVVVGELATHRTTRRLDLPPLSPRGVADLVEGTGLEADQLYQLTGGNPFYLNEIIRDGVGELPASARDAVLAHVAVLSPEARQVLDAAALFGSRVEPALLDAVAPASPAAVDELLACGVLIGDGARLRFRHEIARLAVEQTIGVHRVALIHRGILDALCASGCDDDARLAFHAEGAGAADLVLLRAPLAARRAAELASHREAVAQYERALRFAAGADARTTAGLYDALAYEESLVDRWDDCAQACQAALVLWREVGDALREGDTLGLLSRAMWRLCRGSESQQAAEIALAVLEPLGPSSELAWAYANLAAERMRRSEPAQAIELARRARELGEALGLPAVISDALNTEGCAASDLSGEWQVMLDQSLEIAIREGLDEQTGRAYANIYAMHCGWLTFAAGEHYFVEGIAYCDEHDISTFGTCLRGQRSVALARMGRWDEAVSVAEQHLLTAGSPVNRFNSLLGLGAVCSRRGDPRAGEILDEISALTESLGEPLWIVQARLARAEARWLEGDRDAAAQEVELAQSAATQADVVTRSEVAAWRYRVLGDSVPGSQLVEPFASQVAGDHAAAARLWDDLSCPYDAALALLDASDEALLREALTRLDLLGAAATARVARQRLRDLGVKSIPSGARATTRAHPAGLTRRETEVLELLVDGHTNDEISGRLFISSKTVDHHVSAVLGKLGVASRKVAAREAVRLGLVGAER